MERFYKQNVTVMDIAEYKQRYKDKDSSPGWDSIDNALKKVYGNQEPKHWAPAIHHMLGGEDPLDGISLYKSQSGGIEHFHIITYGFSELYYSEEAFGGEFSKFGFELAFRLKPYEGDGEYPMWALNMLQNIARYVFGSGKWFEEYHYMDAKGPIRQDTNTEISALAFSIDPELGVIQTPHGEVQFLQLFGITGKEYEALKAGGGDSEQLIKKQMLTNPLLITDLNRKNS